ncbi:MAG TPA: glycosyltransferase family 39 protein [Chloroflexota bacterium]|nr:glycosyltransferase family 39 protein [Chloroflexota bacterium]
MARLWVWCTAAPAWLVCTIVMVMAAAYRIALLATTFTRLDADQAIVGLMAFHIQAGDRPVFFYGQPYQGSAEAYGAALFFHLLGAGAWAARLPTLLFSIAFVGAVYWLGRLFYGPYIAVLSALFLALGPSILISSSTACGFGYIEVMVCGTLLFLLISRYPDLRRMPMPVGLVCGLLIGFGLWTQPLMVEYALPAGIALTARLRYGNRGSGRRITLSLGALLFGTALGAAPLLADNLSRHWETLTYLTTRSPGGNHLVTAGRLVTEALPVLTGLVTPTAVPSLFAHLVALHRFWYTVGLGCGIGIVARLTLGPHSLFQRIATLFRPTKDCDAEGIPDQDNRSPGDAMLALFVLCCLLFFIGSSFGAARAATLMPRYLIPLYTAAPLVLDCFVPSGSGRRRRLLAAGAVGTLAACGILVATTAVLPRTSTTAVAGAALSPPPINGLTELLEAQRVRVAYTGYWLANRISFETRERVLGLPIKAVGQLGMIRMPAYLTLAARVPAERLAWIFASGSHDDQVFRHRLQAEHLTAALFPWEELVVYTDLSQRP